MLTLTKQPESNAVAKFGFGYILWVGKTYFFEMKKCFQKDVDFTLSSYLWKYHKDMKTYLKKILIAYILFLKNDKKKLKNC